MSILVLLGISFTKNLSKKIMNNAFDIKVLIWHMLFFVSKLKKSCAI